MGSAVRGTGRAHGRVACPKASSSQAQAQAQARAGQGGCKWHQDVARLIKEGGRSQNFCQ